MFFYKSNEMFKDLSDSVDNVLRGQQGFLAQQVIGGVVNVVLTVQVFLKRLFRSEIAATIEFFHRGFQLGFGLGA
jgi:hypothetical protein